MFASIFCPAALDASALYLIHGRRYLCRKIELTIDAERGLLPLKRGYFYEIN